VVLTAPALAAVSIDPGAFNPPVLNVAAGTTVTWTNNSGGSQSVTSTTAPYAYDSGTLLAGGAYSRTFVAPGVYTYTSIPGGLNATINVTGAANAAVATPMGGQEYRFRMDDTSGGLGIQLCYELSFRDWPGNVLVAPSHCIALTGSLTGTGYCFGDGSGAACPCGNNALVGSDTGCLTSLGFGGRLSASGNASISADTLLLSGQSMPNSSALYFQGTTQQSAGAGFAFGDGKRCVVGSVVRLGTKINAGNASSYPVGGDLSVSVKGLVVAPGTRYYQIWFRNAAAFCQPETFNLSNGWTIVWGS
jgi:plastocyanin